MLKIRKATKEDFEEYFKLEQEYTDDINKIEEIDDLKYSLVKDELKKGFFKKLQEVNKLFLVLDDDVHLYGFLSGYYFKVNTGGCKFKIDKLASIDNLFITKKFRGKGYASKLKKEFFKWLKLNGIEYCFLHVSLKNRDALKVYKSWKFKPLDYKMITKV